MLVYLFHNMKHISSPNGWRFWHVFSFLFYSFWILLMENWNYNKTGLSRSQLRVLQVIISLPRWRPKEVFGWWFSGGPPMECSANSRWIAVRLLCLILRLSLWWWLLLCFTHLFISIVLQMHYVHVSIWRLIDPDLGGLCTIATYVFFWSRRFPWIWSCTFWAGCGYFPLSNK